LGADERAIELGAGRSVCPNMEARPLEVGGVGRPGGEERQTVGGGADEAEGGANDQVGRCFGGTCVSLQRPGRQKVVGVDEGEKGSPCPFKGGVAGDGNATVFREDDRREAGVIAENVAKGGKGVGVRTVENVQEFGVRERLAAEGTGVRAEKRFRDAVDGDDDGKERRGSVRGRRRIIHGMEGSLVHAGKM